MLQADMTNGHAARPYGQISENNRQYKVVLLGETEVGKSSLLDRYVKDQFHEFPQNTIGAAYYTKTIQVKNLTVKLEIWDTAGQERYHVLAPMYYRRSQAAIVVYDITNHVTFEKAKIWTKELQNQVPGSVTILVGNKLDLHVFRNVQSDESQKFADENNLLFMEASAKTSVNVTGIFETIARKLSMLEPADTDGGQSLPIDSDKNKRNCCM